MLLKSEKVPPRFQFALKYSLRPTSGYWKQQLPHLALVNGESGTDMTLNLNVITLTHQLNLQSNLHLLNCRSLLCPGPFCSRISIRAPSSRHYRKAAPAIFRHTHTSRSAIQEQWNKGLCSADSVDERFFPVSPLVYHLEARVMSPGKPIALLCFCKMEMHSCCGLSLSVSQVSTVDSFELARAHT